MSIAEPTPPGARSAPDSGAERILQAAARLFAERGYAGTSMQAVAEAAGVCKSNVFHHFASKEALFEAVLHHASRDFRAELEALSAAGGTLSERLLAFLAGHLRVLDRHAASARLLLQEIRGADEARGRELAERILAPSFAQVVRLLERAQQEGLIRADAELPLAALLLLKINLFRFESEAVLRHLPGVDLGEDPEPFQRRMVELLVQGLRPAKERAP
jgi:TetR/AcrR family transcriptional regulator